MSETRIVRCDHCQLDLTTTSNCEDYYLALVVQAKSIDTGGTGAVTAMAIQPPISRAYHFCGIGCLGEWVKRTI